MVRSVCRDGSIACTTPSRRPDRGHQGDVGDLNGHVGARADGDAQVGLHQRWTSLTRSPTLATTRQSSWTAESR